MRNVKRKSRHNRLRIVAIIILMAVSLNALAAGYSFIAEPSGKGLGIGLDYLKQSAPFRDYFIPGISLFSFIGIGGLFITVMTILRRRHHVSLLLLYGLLLIGWIAIQLLMVRSFHILHLIISVAGFILAAIGWALKAPRTRSLQAFAAPGSN